MIGIEEARRYYQGADAAHDFDHVLRVLKMAERIGMAEGADMLVVRTAVLLHDIGRSAMGDTDHATVGADRAQEILAGHPRQQVQAVVHAIAAHRFRAGPDPDTLEAKVVFTEVLRRWPHYRVLDGVQMGASTLLRDTVSLPILLQPNA